MSQAAVADEATTIQPGEQVKTLAEVPAQLRTEIVAARQNGATLAELKKLFGAQVHMDAVREVLAAANVPAPKPSKPKVTESTQGTGGRSGKQHSDPKPPKAAQPAAPKADPAPKYITDEAVIQELREGVTRARGKGLGRAKIAEIAGTIPMTPYRVEKLGNVLPDEVEPLREALRKIDAGEVELPQRQTPAARGQGVTRSDLLHRIEVATDFLTKVRGDRSVSKAAIVDGVLAVLDPKPEADQPTS